MADLKVDRDFLDLGDRFTIADKSAPSKIYKGLDRLGTKIKKGAESVSPTGTKQKIKKKKLKERWTAENTKKEVDGAYVKKVRSEAPHFHLVERGHKVVPRRYSKKLGKKDEQARVKIRRGKSFVEGSHFFDRYMDMIEYDINVDIEEMFDKILKDLV